MARRTKEEQEAYERAFEDALREKSAQREQIKNRTQNLLAPVSYTHLDVYKRQALEAAIRPAPPPPDSLVAQWASFWAYNGNPQQGGDRL